MIGPNIPDELVGCVLVKTRPIHHPKQIMNVEGLVIGKKYLEMNTDYGAIMTFVFLGQSKNPEWINVKRINWSAKTANQEMSLADCGIIPYEHGWNPTNYLIPIEDC